VLQDVEEELQWSPSYTICRSFISNRLFPGIYPARRELCNTQAQFRVQQLGDRSGSVQYGISMVRAGLQRALPLSAVLLLVSLRLLILMLVTDHDSSSHLQVSETSGHHTSAPAGAAALVLPA
jgi:hypothetical protein